MHPSATFRVRIDHVSEHYVRLTIFDRYGAHCGQLTISLTDAPTFLWRCWFGALDYGSEANAAAIRKAAV